LPRKLPRGQEDDDQLTADIIDLARRYGRYGYRRVAELLRSSVGGSGWRMMVLRLRRGPHPSSAGGGRSAAQRRGQKASEGRTNVPDAERDRRVHPRVPGDPGCPQAQARQTSSTCCPSSSSCAACRATSAPTMVPSSWPRPCRHGSRRWAPGRPTSRQAVPFRTAAAVLIPAGPDRQLCCRWENGYGESFNARLRDELLDGETFYSLRKAQVVIESWRRHSNTARPHASLSYRAPAPEMVPGSTRPATRTGAVKPLIHQHPTRTIRWRPATKASFA
jgi:putative transposase